MLESAMRSMDIAFDPHGGAKVKEKIPIPLNREDFYRARVLQKGGWQHAEVLLCEKGGEQWVVKDFSCCFFVLRETMGAWMVRRELTAFGKLMGVAGVPREMFRLDRYSFGYRYIQGRPMEKDNYSHLKPEFFLKLENLVSRVHERGLVHLDLRGRGNVLVTEKGDPILLDFTSHIDLHMVPGFLRGLLTAIDLSGVYLHWKRRFPLDKKRKELLDRVNRLRLLWIFTELIRLNPFDIVIKPVKRLVKYATKFGHGAANNVVLRRLLVRLRLPLWLVAAIGLAALARPAWFLPGLYVALAGELLQLWCFASLDKNRSLAQEGPYALVRNPMYVGRFFVVLGIVMLSGSPALIAAYIVIYYFYAVNRVRREERRLETIFGSMYEYYRERVPRFVPRLNAWPGRGVWRLSWRQLRRNHGGWNLLAVILFFAAAGTRMLLSR